jgi:hypothetical protein
MLTSIAALRDPGHFAHQIDAGYHFRDRMLDLDARIHLDEEKLAGILVIQILDRACAAIASAFEEPDGRGAQQVTGILVDIAGNGASSQILRRRRCNEHSRSKQCTRCSPSPRTCASRWRARGRKRST